MKLNNKIKPIDPTKENKWYLYILGVVIITVLMLLNNVTANDLSVDLSTNGTANGYTEYSPQLSLPKGEYRFNVGDNTECVVANPDGDELGTGNGRFDVKLEDDESNIIIKSKSSSLKNVKITSSGAIFNDITLIALAICAMLLLLGYVRLKMEKNFEKGAIFIVLIAVALFASYPLFHNYISYGQDLNFHLYRIEGLKDGLLSGQFPVRIDPTHNNGYGYITASVYPSLFFYIPAILRLLAVSLVTSYKSFLVLINIATAIIMYVPAKRITRSSFAGLFAAIVYVMSPWRAENLMYRAAIGESLAMTFFPLVILGLYHIVKGEKSKWWVFALGCTAIFNSHVISCIFVAFLSLVVCLVFIKNIIREKRYIPLIKAAVFTILINMWYLIPFITYYFGVDLAIRHTPTNTQYFDNAIFPAEFFNIFSDQFGYSQLMPLGIKGNMSLTLGAGVTVCLVVAVMYFVFDKKDRIRHYSFNALLLAFAVFIMFMASTLYPNELLQKPGVLNALAGTIRMPWRFLSLASPIICIVTSAVVLVKIKNDTHKKIVLGIATVFCAFSLVFFGSAYTESFDASVKIGQAAPTAYHVGWDNEYFIKGTRVDSLTPEKYTTSDSSVKVVSYDKDGTNIDLTLSGAADGKFVEVPLLYYPGYSAKDDNGQKLEIVKGNNNVLRVKLENGSDNIHIKYAGHWTFKIGCIISLLTLLSPAMLHFYRKRKEL